MKTNINKLVIVTVVIFLSTMLFSFVSPQEKEKKPWKVPEKYKTMENPYAADQSLVKVGKTIYAKHCRSCHGNKGLGDGPKAKKMKSFLEKFNSKAFQANTDGELFYKSIIGRDEMPNYEKKIPDVEDQWAVVMYIKTLK